MCLLFFFFKQKTAYEMRISDWSSDVCSSDLDREQRLQVRQLLLMDQDIGILQLDRHLLGIRDEIGREITAIELHALDNVQLELDAGGLLDGDHAFLADLLHTSGDLPPHALTHIAATNTDPRIPVIVFTGLGPPLEL